MEKRENVDFVRLARFAFFGFLLRWEKRRSIFESLWYLIMCYLLQYSPISHKWYTYLDQVLFKDQSGLRKLFSIDHVVLSFLIHALQA